jgi:cystine transport system substrate-binding protein
MTNRIPALGRRAFLAASAAALTAAIAPAAFADTLDDIRAKGVLVVGSGVVGSKPWMYKNEDGTYGGMEYEMLLYIIKKLGVAKVEIVDTAWETLIPGLKAKRWDVIFSGMTVTEERRQGAGIEFTRPYYFESDRIVVRKDSAAQKPEDLAGKTLGVPLGTVEEIQAKLLIG